MFKKVKLIFKCTVVIGLTGFIMYNIVGVDSKKVEATSLEESNKVIQYIGTLHDTVGQDLLIPHSVKDDLVTRYNEEIKPIVEKNDKYTEVYKDLRKIVHEVNNSSETKGQYLVDTTPENVVEVAKKYAQIELDMLDTVVEGVDVKEVKKFIDSTDAEKIETIEGIVVELNSVASEKFDEETIQTFLKDVVKGVSESSKDGSLEVGEMVTILKSNESIEGAIKELQQLKEQSGLDLGDETLKSYILTVDKILTTEK